MLCKLREQRWLLFLWLPFGAALGLLAGPRLWFAGAALLLLLIATYGAGSVQRDVSDMVKQKIEDGHLEFSANSSELGGDPIFGQVKTFFIKYSYNGQVYEHSFREGEQVSLPDYVALLSNVDSVTPQSDLKARIVVKENMENYGGGSMLVTGENDTHTYREMYTDVSIGQSTVSWTVHRISGDQEVIHYKELLDLSEITKGSFRVEFLTAHHDVEANVTNDFNPSYRIVGNALRNRSFYNLRGDPGQYAPTFLFYNKDAAYTVAEALNTLTERVNSKQTDVTTVPEMNRFPKTGEQEVIAEQAQRIAKCPCEFCESKTFGSFELPPSDPMKKNLFGNSLVYSVPLLDRKNAFTVAIDNPIGSPDVKYTGIIFILIPHDYNDYSDSEKTMWQQQEYSFIQYVTGLQNASDIIKQMLDAGKAVRTHGWYFTAGGVAENLFIVCAPETSIKNYENALSLDGKTLNPAQLTNIQYTTTTSNGEVTITGLSTARSGPLVIPGTINGLPVTSIGSCAFSGCTSLTSVTLPNSVTSIGNLAFAACTRLTNETIPGSVTSIGEDAFSSCIGLTSVTIPDSVTSIGEGAFAYCTGLTNVTIPSSVTSIGEGAFSSCTALTSATFLGDAPTMGSVVFTGTAHGFTVYYVDGASGFTTPSWEGYPSVNSIPTTVAGGAGQSGSSDTASAATSPDKDTSPPSPTTSWPVAGEPWTNSLGVKFVPAGTDGVLFSVWDVRVKDYRAFVEETGGHWHYNSDDSPTDNDPAVAVSWDDAHSFCDWLTKKEQAEGKLGPNQSYRLPTDAEWSKAVGLGDEGTGTPEDKNGKISGVYPWGTQWPPPSGAGNYDGEDFAPGIGIKGYRDGYENTSPVGSFNANKYGLYDMGGNVLQWCEDKYNNESDLRVLRGSSFISFVPDSLLSSFRDALRPTVQASAYGFRVVVVVSP